MRIGIDVDGVLAELCGGFTKWAENYCNQYLEAPRTWRFYADQWGWTDGEFQRAHRAFVQDGGYRDLAVIGGDQTRTALQRLAAAGHTIVLITARGSGLTFGEKGVIHRQTADWLQANGIVHHELHLTDRKTDVPVHWMLDDNLDNYRAMQQAGVDAFIMDQPWNQVDDDSAANIVRVSTVAEYVHTILEEQEQPVTGVHLEADAAGNLWDPASEVRVTSATGGQKGSKGARFDLLPSEALWEVAELYGKGAAKYQDRNWERGYDFSLSYAALQRHANQFWQGIDTDDETGLSHMASVVFHALALMTFVKTHPEYDNRPRSQEEAA